MKFAQHKRFLIAYQDWEDFIQINHIADTDGTFTNGPSAETQKISRQICLINI